MEEIRERRSDELFARLARLGYEPTPDLARRIALIASAINYLAVRSRTIRIFSGVDVQSDEGWAALYASMHHMLGEPDG